MKLDQTAKKQASDCIKKLQEKFMLARAEMKIQLHISNENKEKLLEELKSIQIEPNEQFDDQNKFTIICSIEPSKYRDINDILKNKIKGKIKVY